MNFQIYCRYCIFLLSCIFFSSTYLIALYETIAPGIYYKNIVSKKPALSIHVLIADPHHINMSIGVANNKCTSAQKTTHIAQQHHALAAINAGFFDFGYKNKMHNLLIKGLDCIGYDSYNAFPIYTLSIDKNYYSLSSPSLLTGAIGWNNQDQHPFFGLIKTTATLTHNGKIYTIDEFNMPYSDKPTLYNKFYDEKSPHTRDYVDEIIIENNQIKKIYTKSRGKKNIPKNGYVYVLPKKYSYITNSLKQDDYLSIQIINTQLQVSHYNPHNKNSIINPTDPWPPTDNIVAGTPLLIHNGHIVPYLSDYQSEFYTSKHPRSAIGILDNNNWVFLVVDGRQKHSKGFTIIELAHFMKELGCTNALNLDGGGSATMVIKNKIINSPSGRQYCLRRKERPVSNAFLLSTRE